MRLIKWVFELWQTVDEDIQLVMQLDGGSGDCFQVLTAIMATTMESGVFELNEIEDLRRWQRWIYISRITGTKLRWSLVCCRGEL